MRISGKHWDDATRSEVARRLSVPGVSASRVAAEMGLRKQSVIDFARRMREPGTSSEFTPVYQGTVKPRVRVPYRSNSLDHTSVEKQGFSASGASIPLDQFSTYEQIHGRKETEKAGVPFAMPEGHVLKGVSALVDGEGKEVLRWVKTREDLSVADIVETIREAFRDYEGMAAPIPVSFPHDRDLLTLFPLADWHVGLFSWQGETGTNWDLKIAERTIGQGIDDLVNRSPASAHAIVLGGGDLLHSDNQENRTARSGNALQVDGRYQKVLMSACRLVVRTVDACLRKHQHVTVRILPGNHDEHSSVAVAYFLLAWYRDEPRVTVDADASLFFWFRFGKVMLGGTHGHLAKAKDMPMIMAHRRAEDWGVSKFRYIHTFHLHNDRETKTEGGGCVTEIHRTPTPQDAWHFGSGFLSGRSLKSITYHAAHGEVSRCTLAIFDAGYEAA